MTAAVVSGVSGLLETFIRRAMAFVVWVFLVPYATIWLLRTIFAPFEALRVLFSTVPPLIGRPIEYVSHVLGAYTRYMFHLLFSNNPTDLAPPSFDLSGLRMDPANLRLVATDLLHGQMVTVTIVVSGLVLMGVREYVVFAVRERLGLDENVADENVQEENQAAPANEPVPGDQPAPVIPPPAGQGVFGMPELLEPNGALHAPDQGFQPGMNFQFQLQPPHQLQPQPQPQHPPIFHFEPPPQFQPAQPQPQPQPQHAPIFHVQPPRQFQFQFEPAQPQPPPQAEAVEPNPDDEEEIDMDLPTMLGLTSFSSLLRSSVVVFGVETFALSVLGWAPWTLGRIVRFSASPMWNLGLWALRKGDESVLEPVVEGLVRVLKVAAGKAIEFGILANGTGTNATTVSVNATVLINSAHLFNSTAEVFNTTQPSDVPAVDQQTEPVESIFSLSLSPSHPFPPLPTVDIWIHGILGHLVIWGIVWILYGKSLRGSMYGRALVRFGGVLASSVSYYARMTWLLLIELAVFPLLIGSVLTFSTLSVFGSTVATRWAWHERHPVASSFLVAVCGTWWMFQISRYISLLKGLFRPGAIWFVRDPSDPRGGIGEVLEKPWRDTARKMAMSLVFYSCVGAGVVGGSVFLAGLLGRTLEIATGWKAARIWPLLWDPSAALWGGEQVPIDLLAINLVVPFVVRWVNPGAWISKGVGVWWRAVARWSGMGHMLFGSDELQAADTVLLRVPNRDQAPAVQGQMVQVWEAGRQLEGREGESAEEVALNWTLVRAPKRWKLVGYGLAAAQVASWALLGGLSWMPMLLGRWIVERIDERVDLRGSRGGLVVAGLPVKETTASMRPELILHDAYSFFLGWGVVVSVIGVLRYGPGLFRGVARFLERPQLRALAQALPLLALYPVAGILLGLVLPLLVGSLFSVYLLIPLKFPRDATHLTFPLTDWALGAIYLKIHYNLTMLQPDPPELGAQWLLRNPRPMDPNWVKQILGKVLWPMTSVLVALLLGPWIAVRGFSSLLVARFPDTFGVDHAKGIDEQTVRELAHRWAYPATLAAVLAWEVIGVVAEASKVWLEKERDARFLVGRRLRNFEGRESGAVRNAGR